MMMTPELKVGTVSTSPEGYIDTMVEGRLFGLRSNHCKTTVYYSSSLNPFSRQNMIQPKGVSSFFYTYRSITAASQGVKGGFCLEAALVVVDQSYIGFSLLLKINECFSKDGATTNHFFVIFSYEGMSFGKFGRPTHSTDNNGESKIDC